MTEIFSTAAPKLETTVDLTELNRRLVANAFLFEDPRAYAAGVSDALDAVRRLLQWDGIIFGAGGRDQVQEKVGARNARLEP